MHQVWILFGLLDQLVRVYEMHPKIKLRHLRFLERRPPETRRRWGWCWRLRVTLWDIFCSDRPFIAISLSPTFKHGFVLFLISWNYNFLHWNHNDIKIITSAATPFSRIVETNIPLSSFIRDLRNFSLSLPQLRTSWSQAPPGMSFLGRSRWPWAGASPWIPGFNKSSVSASFNIKS